MLCQELKLKNLFSKFLHLILIIALQGCTSNSSNIVRRSG